MIFHLNLQSTEGERKELKLSADSLLVITTYTPNADITARVPSVNLEAFLYRMADLGYYTSGSTMDIDDRSLVYLENTLKQKNRQEVLAGPITANRKGATTLQTIALKDEMIEQDMTNRAINADVAYSTVRLFLFQNPLVRKETIANYYISGYELPFVKRWTTAVREGWSYFLQFLLTLTYLWAFILFALLIWIFYRYGLQKKKAIW
jgi:hypothetical protein